MDRVSSVPRSHRTLRGARGVCVRLGLLALVVAGASGCQAMNSSAMGALTRTAQVLAVRMFLD